MASSEGLGPVSAYRTPRSAIAFAVLLIALVVLYVVVVFVYGRGWWDLAGGILGVLVVFGVMAYLTLLARWWSRGWRRP